MSRNKQTAALHVGERLYVETTIDRYPSDMRMYNCPVSRRPVGMRHMRFTTSLFTAVGAGQADDIRYLLCVERIK